MSRAASHLAGRHRLGVGLLTAAAAAVYVTYGLVQYATFRIGTYDLVIFDQAVRSYAHLHDGISPVKGVQDGFGPAFSVLGDHWSPVIAVLAPLYWLHDGPQDLVVAQGVLFALAVPPLWLFTRRACAAGTEPGSRGPVAAAYLACVAYALSWPVAGALAAGFHEVAFVPVLTAVFFERLSAGKLRVALAAAAALLLVKEDMGLLVAGFGLFLLASGGARFVRWSPGHPLAARRRRLLLAAALIAGGIAAMVVATYVLRPAFGGRASYYWAYWSLGRDAAQAAAHAAADPFSLFRLVVTPGVKVSTMAWLAGVLLFLPLLSPVTLAALPLLAERMLASGEPNWWTTAFQYNAFIELVLIVAAVDGAVRLNSWLSHWHRPEWLARGRAGVAGGSGGRLTGITGLTAVTAVAVVPLFALVSLLTPGFWRDSPRVRAEAAADAVIPAGVTVDAAQMLGPHLSGRDTVLLWGPSASTAPWIVAQVHYTFPFRTLPGQRAGIRQLEAGGYQIVYQRDGYLVLHRPSPVTEVRHTRRP